jgi:hypothetical protein
MTTQTDIYTAVTPFGAVAVDFPEEGGSVFTGDAGAVEYLKSVIGQCVGQGGQGLTPESIEPVDFVGFCQPDGSGILIIEPFDLMMEDAMTERAPVLDSVSPIERLKLSTELATQSQELATNKALNAIQRARIAAQVTQLIAQLSTESPADDTTPGDSIAAFGHKDVGFKAIGKANGIFYEKAIKTNQAQWVNQYDLIDNEDVVKTGIVGEYNALVELGNLLRSKGLLPERDANIGRKWASKDGEIEVVGYFNGDKSKYITTKAGKVFGAPIIPAAEIESHISFDVRQAQSHARWEAEVAAKEQAEREAKAARDAEYADIGGEPGETAMARARRITALSALIRVDGIVKTKKRMVDDKVAAGERTSVSEEDRIKPMSRAAFNRANQREQDAHAKRVRDGGKVNVYQLGDSVVDKIAYDYANYVISKTKPAV